MENEVVIHVRARGDEARRDLARIETDARRVGKSSGDSLSTGISGSLMRSFAKVGAKMTETLGEASAKLPGMLSGAVSALPPQGQAVALVLVAGLAASLGPMLAAALSAALLLALGGGVLAAGIMSAVQDPKVKSAFEGLGKTAKDVFKDFGEPFRAPLIRAAKTFQGVLKDIAPQINKLGETIAPVIDKLAPALGGMFKNMLPGIQKAVEASVPLFETLAEHLPKLGDAVSRFFGYIAEAGPSANVFFNDLLTAVEGFIIALGATIGWLAKMYVHTRTVWVATARMIGNAIDAVRDFGRSVGNAVSSAVRWFGRLLDRIGDLPGDARNAANRAGNALTSAFRTARDRVADAIRAVISRIAGVVTGARNAANNARDALVNAFRAARDRAVAAIRELVSRAAQALRDIPKTITINITQKIKQIGEFLNPFAHGGIVGGAATGGVHSGLRMVGEHGPELLSLPPGTRVHSNPDTERLMSGDGAVSGPVTINLLMADGQVLARAVLPSLQHINRTEYAGSVSRMFPATR